METGSSKLIPTVTPSAYHLERVKLLLLTISLVQGHEKNPLRADLTE